MDHINDFFISHNSEDNTQAKALYDLLKSIHPEWKVFLDCSEEKPLESYDEWRARMLQEAVNSRYLIFIASNPDFLKEGNGWLYEEVSVFQNLKASRFRRNRADRNIAYFGILFGQWNFEKDLFSDPDRGSEYRRLYDRPEHLILGSDVTVADAAQRIRNKIENTVNQAASETAAELLDLTRNFAAVRRSMDPMFSMDAICENLIPKLKDSDGHSLTFDGLCSMLQHSHVALRGSEGGSGKTSMMTKLFYHFLDCADPQTTEAGHLIPLYVDAKVLAAENFLILRYLAKHLYGEHTAMVDRSASETIGKLNREFSLQADTPRYLLIIDGYNEIPSGSLSAFNNELTEFFPQGRYRNVRVVIAGRYLEHTLPGDVFQRLTLSQLELTQITSYLKANGVWRGRENRSLLKILSIPMYLKLYVDTAADDRIHTKGELLLKFVQWQKEKESAAGTDDGQKALYNHLLYHLLPLVSHRLTMSNSTASAFIFTEDELQDILETALELVEQNAYKRYYGNDYRNDLRQIRSMKYDALDFADLFVEYFTRNCKLLRQNAEGKYEFIHQIYRDFFCAWYVSEDIKRSVAAERAIQCLSDAPLETDVRDFTVELLGEGKPVFNMESQRWDYSCNQQSWLFKLPDLARKNGQAGDTLLVANIVELLKYARDEDLSGCDFSGLDLRGSNLRACNLYRYDAAGRYPSTFAGAFIDRENLLCDNHFSALRAACLNQDGLACIDADGILKFWHKTRYTISPYKIITNVGYAVQKMLFAPEGDRIYAMTAHEILEIPIPDMLVSKAQPRVLYETTKKLRDIYLDAQGQLFFTTAFNAFNPKPLSDPEAPNLRNFHSINSCAAVNDAGDQLAFGHVAGFDGLKIYNRCCETGQWQEQKVGYSKLLEDYVLELESLLYSFGLQRIFPIPNREPSSTEPKRNAFFFQLQMQFEDRVHDYEEMPALLLKRVLKELLNRSTRLPREQLSKLYAASNDFKQRILDLKKENPLLLSIGGRNISSIAYRPGTNTLLLSCVSKYPDKNIYDSLILELNTQTLATRFIKRFTSDHKLKALYCQDGIIVIGNYHLIVFDWQGGDTIHVATRPKAVQRFIRPVESSTFYALSFHFIYAFDEIGQCTGAQTNPFGTPNLTCCADENGKVYLARGSDLTQKAEGEEISVLDLSNGAFYSIPHRLHRHAPSGTSVVFGDKAFKTCTDKLVGFDREIKVSQLDICYKLFICGCDFTGIRGNLASADDLALLSRFGAITDSVNMQAVESLPATPITPRLWSSVSRPPFMTI